MTVMDFADLMPHRIKVRLPGGRDDFGYPLPDQGQTTYACLMSDRTTVVYTQAGPARVYEHVAYLIPYGLNPDGTYATTPTLITTESILTTSDNVDHYIKNVETHYDETGNPHNQTIVYE